MCLVLDFETSRSLPVLSRFSTQDDATIAGADSPDVTGRRLYDICMAIPACSDIDGNCVNDENISQSPALCARSSSTKPPKE